MSAFDLGRSLVAAQRRFAGTKDKRSRDASRTRSDKGHARIHPEVEQLLQALLQGRDKPAMASLGRETRELCATLGVAPPARGTLYNVVARARPPKYAMQQLPKSVREALYNSTTPAAGSGGVEIPGDQVVFYCFNYGDVRAISYAAGMPWLCLVCAAARRGFRPKSLALLRAVMSVRGV